MTDDLCWDEDWTAQDVLDAMRVAVQRDGDPEAMLALVLCLMEFGPETTSNRGLDLLMRMISQRMLRVSIS